MVIFLKLADWLYCKVESPNATIKAHMKQSTEAAKACGIEARMAPTFPVESKQRNQLYLSANGHKYVHYISSRVYFTRSWFPKSNHEAYLFYRYLTASNDWEICVCGRTSVSIPRFVWMIFNHGDLPMNERKIKKAAPICKALRLAIFVMLIVCTFSVKVVEPVPEPQSPANTLQKPSNPIPRLIIPGVGGFELTSSDVEWYVPTWIRAPFASG